MDLSLIPQLLLLAAASVLTSLGFYLLKKLTPYGRIKKPVRQVIIGVAFGLVAILSTEMGVDVNGATINARDAAPLCAGLLFGAPAGIIAGVIGGV